MKNNSSVAFAFLLIVGDFIALLGAFVVAYILRVTLDQRPLLNQLTATEYLQIWFFLTPIWILIFALLGLYRRNVYEYRWRELGGLFAGTILGTMAVITYDFISESAIFPARLIPVYALIVGFLFLVLERTILRSARMLLWRYGTGVNNILVIGKGEVFKNFVNSIDAPSKTGYKVVAVATNETPSKFTGKTFLDTNEALENIAKLKIHTVLYIGSSSDSQAANTALAAAQANHAAFKFVPTHDGILSNNIEVDLFQGLPVVSVHQTSLTGWGRIAKRIFDVVSSLFGLIILSPLFIILGLLVFLADGGKPIFKHKRLSRFDTEVGIYKFRSMSRKYSGLEPEEAFAKMGKPELAKKYRANGDRLDNDPRVTKVGKFLRKTSLDELPQLLNVLKGDISLVGPRALAPAELKNYPYKNLILSVKSGLTGLAQISGRREISFEERRTLDLYYVQNWSFFMDIKIIFRTIIMVLTGRGAQ